MPATVDLSPSDSQVCFNVTIEDDQTGLEPPESFTLNINNLPINVGVTLDESVITILDDDGEWPQSMYV